LPGHPAILRSPAHDLQPDSDLGARLVTRDVGKLSGSEIQHALEAGADHARKLLAAGLIDGAALRLQGKMVIVAMKGIGMRGSRALPRSSTSEGAMHA